MTQRQNLRNAYANLAGQFEPNVMITLATNQVWEVQKMRKLIGAFSARLDDGMLGSMWSKKPISERANGVFFIEHVRANIHAHGLVKLPYDLNSAQALTTGIWERLCPSGTVHWREIDDMAVATSYGTKELTRHDHRDDQIVLLTEFMPPTLSQGPTTQR